MFGYRHLFEPYVPKEKRERGYFTMPLLAGGQIVGLGRPGARTARRSSPGTCFLEKPAAVAPMARALAEAAQWVGCDERRCRTGARRLRSPSRLPARCGALGV